MATSLCDEKENLRDLLKNIYGQGNGWEGGVLGREGGGEGWHSSGDFHIGSINREIIILGTKL